MNIRKLTGITLSLIGILTAVFVLYNNSSYSKIKRVFSPYSILSSSWDRYKTQFLNQDGRVLDHLQNGITTSEGQSYILLRSVWIDDKPTFDLSWKWTKENLKRPADNLFGWRWGKREDGSFGFLSNGGENSASDADVDIALALILASKRWNQGSYQEEAQKILPDIWDKETDVILGKRYLVAGNWAISADRVIINPSYFAPYAWRVFSQFDGKRDWLSLVDPAYELLANTGTNKLDKDLAVGLPPDWVSMDKKTGQLLSPNIGDLKTDYSFDAMRIPFRIALDYQWYKQKQSQDYLNYAFSVLNKDYSSDKKLAGSYSHDGKPLTNIENPAMYATALGYFVVHKPEQAKNIYQEKIMKLYANDKDTFNTDIPYYEQNWLWFGAALYNNFLKNFTI